MQKAIPIETEQEVRAQARALIASHGVAHAARTLGVTRACAIALAAGAPIRVGNLSLATQALGLSA